jgi:hypothetical protein
MFDSLASAWISTEVSGTSMVGFPSSGEVGAIAPSINSWSTVLLVVWKSHYYSPYIGLESY